MSRVSQIPNIPRLNNPVEFNWTGERAKARRKTIGTQICADCHRLEFK
jgi:hypothetical protein